MQDGAAGRLIHAARFHADEPVLHQVHAADAVLAAELVQTVCIDAERVSSFLPFDRHALPFSKSSVDVFRLVRRVLRRHAELVHRLVFRRGASSHGSSKNARLERNVQEIAVHRIRLLRRGLRRGCRSPRNRRSSPRGPGNCSRNDASRHGAMTCNSGASAAAVSSNRTWSLPLPVAPWAMASAFSRRAISTMRLAMSGRAMLVPRKYWFS